MNTIIQAMECPKCYSKLVVETDNLHMLWACNECGYQDDGEEFDTTYQGRENVVVDIPVRGGWKVVAFALNGELKLKIIHDKDIVIKQARYSKYNSEIEYIFTNKEKFYEHA